jgi:hypothetical protein
MSPVLLGPDGHPLPGLSFESSVAARAAIAQETMRRKLERAAWLPAGGRVLLHGEPAPREFVGLAELLR